MMKKTLLLSALALGLISSTANAITADDLDGKTGVILMYSNYAGAGYPGVTYTGNLRSIGNNKVTFDNFFGNDFTVTFDVVNNKLRLVVQEGNSGNEPIQFQDNNGNYYAEVYKAVLQGSGRAYGLYLNGYGWKPSALYTVDRTHYSYIESANYGSISQTPWQGFEFSGPIAIEEYNSYKSTVDVKVMDEFTLFVLDTKAEAFDTTGRTYKTDYEISGSTITFKNFFNIGVKFPSYQNNIPYSDVTGNINNNNITISYQTVGGWADYYNWGWCYQPETYDYYAGTGYWVSQLAEGYKNYIGSKGQEGVNVSGNISGKINNNIVSHYQLKNNNYWAYDKELGGSWLKTIKDQAITFDRIAYQFYYDRGINGDPDYDLYRDTEVADKTLIYKRENDVTHSVALQNMKMGYGEINANGGNYLYVEGDILPGENADYVESYELYVIPGSYKAVTDAAFNNASKGHNNGFSLEDYVYTSAGTVKPNSINLNDEEGPMHFQYAVPEKDLAAAGAKNNQANAYTFYVKTNYTAESGLEPTYHALTAISNTTTGVDDILTGTVNDDDAPVYFYNMNGVLVDGENLTPGLYIRRQGATSTKVLIK